MNVVEKEYYSSFNFWYLYFDRNSIEGAYNTAIDLISSIQNNVRIGTIENNISLIIEKEFKYASDSLSHKHLRDSDSNFVYTCDTVFGIIGVNVIALDKYLNCDLYAGQYCLNIMLDTRDYKKKCNYINFIKFICDIKHTIDSTYIIGGNQVVSHMINCYHKNESNVQSRKLHEFLFNFNVIPKANSTDIIGNELFFNSFEIKNDLCVHIFKNESEFHSDIYNKSCEIMNKSNLDNIKLD